jgi:acyl carrier protein
VVRSTAASTNLAAKDPAPRCRQGFIDNTLRVVEQDVLPLATAEGEEALPDRASLLALPADQRQPVLAEAMRRQLARLLKVDPSSVALDTPVTELGIDSLAVVELRHQVETDLGVEIPFDLLIEGASLEGLAAHVVDHACAGGQ